MTLAGLARWCFRRRRLVLLLWIIGFVVINGAGAAIGSAYTDNFHGGHSDAQKAFDLLRTRFPARAGDTADVVFYAPRGVTSNDIEQAANAFMDQARTMSHVVAVDKPFQLGRVSADGSIAYGTV